MFISSVAGGSGWISPPLWFAIWWSVWSYWVKFDVSQKTYWVGWSIYQKSLSWFQRRKKNATSNYCLRHGFWKQDISLMLCNLWKMAITPLEIIKMTWLCILGQFLCGFGGVCFLRFFNRWSIFFVNSFS